MLKKPRSLSLSTSGRCSTLSSLCGSELDSLKQSPVLLELRGPELHTIFQMWSHRAEQRGRRTSLDLLTTGLLTHPRMPLAFLAARRAQCLLTVILLSPRTPRPLSPTLLTSRSVPNLYWYLGLLLSRLYTCPCYIPLSHPNQNIHTFLSFHKEKKKEKKASK